MVQYGHYIWVLFCAFFLYGIYQLDDTQHTHTSIAAHFNTTTAIEMPSVSPNGRYIAFCDATHDAYRMWIRDIEHASDHIVQTTQHPIYSYYWNHENTHLLCFQADHKHHSRLYMLDITHGTWKDITHGQAHHMEPIWRSPRNPHILAVTIYKDDGSAEIHRLHIPSATYTFVTHATPDMDYWTFDADMQLRAARRHNVVETGDTKQLVSEICIRNHEHEPWHTLRTHVHNM